MSFWTKIARPLAIKIATPFIPAPFAALLPPPMTVPMVPYMGPGIQSPVANIQPVPVFGEYGTEDHDDEFLDEEEEEEE